MYNYFKTFIAVCILSGAVIALNGCVKDNCRRTYTYTIYEPVYKTSAEVRANIKSNPPTDIKSPGKIVLHGNYIFLNEINKGIHVINNTNPAAPQNIAFIDIPGNVDLAVKGNTLYADLYTDLVVLDITDPRHVTKQKIVDYVFPSRYYGGGIVSATNSRIIYDWIKHDTVITEDCSYQGWRGRGGIVFFSSNPAADNTGINKTAIGITGSMSRFAMIDNFLYTVGESDLNSFDITTSSNPVLSNNILVDWHVETIYPFKDKLFVGSNNGMYIYDAASNPAKPSKVGQFIHARACDPVIADDNYAYITLHSGSTCLGYNNQLDIVKLNNLTNATFAKTYSFTSPQGLSKDGNLLFICDGKDGLKIYNAADVMDLKLLTTINSGATYDVIAYNGIALVVAENGLYQYDYSNIYNIRLLSKIGVSK